MKYEKYESKLYKDLLKEGKDYIESIMEKIKSGDTVSIIFFLKTQGRRRGYSERYQIEGNFPLQISFIEDLKD